MPRHILIILGVILGTAIILRVVGWFTAEGESFVTIRGEHIVVEIADTANEQERGLSGRMVLAPDRGMLFLYPQKTIPRFWMRGMFIPLDIIWIADGRITGIAPNIPAPSLATPESALPIYSPEQPVTMVLEVNAGTAARFGWRVGDAVDISFAE